MNRLFAVAFALFAALFLSTSVASIASPLIVSADSQNDLQITEQGCELPHSPVESERFVIN